MASQQSGGFDLARRLDSRVTLRDGHRMPVVGLGVWKTAPGAETTTSVRAALDAGYRHVDTASMYRNEADVGEAIRSSGLPEGETFVTTKVWNDEQGFEPTLRAFQRSRRSLGVKVVDLYLIHWPVPGLRSETWKALLQLQRDGECRSIGVSNYGVAHLEELIDQSGVVPAVNQVEFSPFLFQRELLDYCQKHRIQLEAYAPLTRGHRLQDPTILRLAARHRRSGAQVLLRWGLQHGVVVIPKSVHPERIRENGDLFTFQLTRSEMMELDALDARYRTAWDPSSTP